MGEKRQKAYRRREGGQEDQEQKSGRPIITKKRNIKNYRGRAQRRDVEQSKKENGGLITPLKPF